MLELRVADWARSIDWYRAFTAQEPVLLDITHQFALFRCGDAQIALKQGVPHIGSVLIYFQVSDLEAWAAACETHSILPTSPMQISDEGYRRLRFTDPDGYDVGLFEWIPPEKSPVPLSESYNSE